MSIFTSKHDGKTFCLECGYLETVCECWDDVEIDKCLNCGRYKASDSLNKDQVCKVRCTNPNEY